MTRKDFIAIAEQLGDQLGFAYHMAYDGGSENVELWKKDVSTTRTAILKTASALSNINPRFNLDKFCDHAEECAKLARKRLEAAA